MVSLIRLDCQRNGITGISVLWISEHTTENSPSELQPW